MCKTQSTEPWPKFNRTFAILNFLSEQINTCYTFANSSKGGCLYDLKLGPMKNKILGTTVAIILDMAKLVYSAPWKIPVKQHPLGCVVILLSLFNPTLEFWTFSNISYKLQEQIMLDLRTMLQCFEYSDENSQRTQHINNAQRQNSFTVLFLLILLRVPVVWVLVPPLPSIHQYLNAALQKLIFLRWKC